MKITLLIIGKTDESYLREGIALYEKRMKNYLSFEIKTIPEQKTKLTTELLKEKEGDLILNCLKSGDELVLLDERGKEKPSVEFANYVSRKMASGLKNLVFVIGGAYGFSQKVYERANDQLSLSQMTFSHQLVRLIFMEQIYRAMTIIKGEPYHHV